MNDEQTQPDAPKTPAPGRMSLRAMLLLFLLIIVCAVVGVGVFVVHPTLVQEKFLDELKTQGVSFISHSNVPGFPGGKLRDLLRLDLAPRGYDGPFVSMDPNRSVEIRVLRRLTSISESGTKPQTLENDPLWWIAQCPELDRITIQTPLQDAVLKPVGELRNLRLLAVDASKLTGEFLSHLNADTIEVLSLANARTNKQWASRLGAFTRLDTIKWVDSQIDSSTLLEVQKLPSAPLLWINSSTTAWPDVVDVENSSLKMIIFSKSRIDRSALAGMSRLPRLQTLAFSESIFKAADLEELSKSSSLESIEANESGVDDESLAMIGRIKPLVELKISRADVSSRGIAHLAGLPNLELLEIDDTKIDDAAAEPLAKIGSLRTLSMINTAIGDAGFEILIKQGKLKSLDVTGAKVSSKGLEVLFEKRSLEEISMNDSILTYEIREKIKAANPDLKFSTAYDAPAEPCP